MIDHVEVVTGGASATYGSDAMAGVVNFILKKDFEGVQIDGTLGIDQNSTHNDTIDSAISRAIRGGFVNPLQAPGDRWDGQNQDVSLIMGANAPDGKGNATVYLEYHHQSPVLYRDRDFSDCQFVPTSATAGRCVGSANSNYFSSLAPDAPNCATGTCTVVGHSFLPWPQRNSTPASYFNSNNYEYLSRGDTRYLGGFEAHYDFSKEISLYSEFNFMHDNTVLHIAPSGAFIGGNPFDPNGAGGFLVNCNNPALSAQEAGQIGCSGADFSVVGAGTLANPEGALKDVFIGRRNIEGGPRISTYDHFNYRGVVGLRGDVLDDVWHYDVYGSYYYTFLNQVNSNYLSYSRIGKSLDVLPGVGGAPAECASVATGADAACVPWDIFQDGGVTKAALNYLGIIGTEGGTVREYIVEGDATGDLGKYGVKSPWANDGVGVSFGFDWRRDNLDFVPDAVIGSGDLAGGAGVGAEIHKGIGVWEGYGETKIPIAQKLPYADLVELDAGVRYSSYDTGPAPWTYKVGLQWSPVEDFRFRASYQRAIRAPSVIELFNPVTVTQSNQFGQNGDPCSGAAPVFTLQECVRTGLDPALYTHIAKCVANQCDVSTGGNPALKPEQADTYSVGATLRPHWVRNLTLSIDWWDIKETGFIGTLTPNLIVDQCGTTGAAQFCSLIHRAPATGFLFGPSDLVNGGYVVGVASNINAGEAEGIDFQGDYRLDLDQVGAPGYGSLTFSLNGSLYLTNSTILPGTIGSYDCAGLFGAKCQAVTPDWRHSFRLTWNTPWNVLASLQWRYIAGVALDTNTSNPILTNHKHDAFDATIPAINYLDLSGQWRINTTFTVRAGINNILNQDPPLLSSKVTGTGSPNTYPTYDLLGRQLFISGTARW
jgi:outer membrane receptor protein involved in Fe transport